MRISILSFIIACASLFSGCWFSARDPIAEIPTAKLLEAPPFRGPDRVHLTSGRHVGGKNSMIRRIIIHITDSEGKSAENWFHHPNPPQGQAVSAHYIIEKDGSIVQIVEEHVVAHHCAGQNTGSIGIEFVGKLLDSNLQTFTSRQIESGICLVAHLQKKYGIPDSELRGHREFTSKECPGKKNFEVFQQELRRYLPE